VKLVLATANADKVAEITDTIAAVTPSIELVARPLEVGDVVEDAGSLWGNARLKAAAIAEATGLPALADDTGFFVDALPGELGVEAAHWGGADRSYVARNRELLARLGDADDRSARFETVALVRWPDGVELSCVGAVSGRIAHEAAGDTGWGFDPVFIPDGFDRTFAELGPAVKRRHSHRGRAFRSIAELLGGGDITIRPAVVDDAPACAVVHIAARLTAMPSIALAHPAADVIRWQREVVFPSSEVWVAERSNVVVGVLALGVGWIDQLYLDPTMWRRGVGRRLVEVARQRTGRNGLQLWTFQANDRARAFYESIGFVAVEETDGSGNEERAPDVRYVLTNP
jgi:XTP/dITP diphosphohydrolase